MTAAASAGHLDFDPAVLAGVFGADVALIRSVVSTYLESMATAITELKLALANSDDSTAQAVAHRIKGASRMSGALVLADVAGQIERLAMVGDMPAVVLRMAELEVAWARLVTALSAPGATA